MQVWPQGFAKGKGAGAFATKGETPLAWAKGKGKDGVSFAVKGKGLGSQKGQQGSGEKGSLGGAKGYEEGKGFSPSQLEKGFKGKPKGAQKGKAVEKGKVCEKGGPSQVTSEANGCVLSEEACKSPVRPEAVEPPPEKDSVPQTPEAELKAPEGTDQPEPVEPLPEKKSVSQTSETVRAPEEDAASSASANEAEPVATPAAGVHPPQGVQAVQEDPRPAVQVSAEADATLPLAETQAPQVPQFQDATLPWHLDPPLLPTLPADTVVDGSQLPEVCAGEFSLVPRSVQQMESSELVQPKGDDEILEVLRYVTDNKQGVDAAWQDPILSACERHSKFESYCEFLCAEILTGPEAEQWEFGGGGWADVWDFHWFLENTEAHNTWWTRNALRVLREQKSTPVKVEPTSPAEFEGWVFFRGRRFFSTGSEVPSTTERQDPVHCSFGVSLGPVSSEGRPRC